MALPTFICIGAQRCGTTSLQAALSAHPQIFLPPKETDFFLRGHDGVLPPWIANWRANVIPRDFTAYARLFDRAGDAAAVGEISPSYLYGPVAQRIGAVLPQCKIICILRHPVDQARSILATWLGRQPTETELQVQLKSNASGPNCDLPLSEHGRYDRHLVLYFEIFGARQLKVGLFEELVSAPMCWLDELQVFLGVEPRRLEFPHLNSSAAPHVRGVLVGSTKSFAKRMLPSWAVSRIASGMNRARAGLAPPSPNLPSQLKGDLLVQHYAPTVEQLRQLGIDTSLWERP